MWNFVFAGEFRRCDFPFNTALSEATRNQDTGHVLEMAINAALKRFGVDQFQFDPAILARRSVGERFVDAFIRVLQIDVFADDRDLDLFLRAHYTFHEFPPIRQVRFRRIDLEQLAD